MVHNTESDDVTFPPADDGPRTLVLCFDGTLNRIEATNTGLAAFCHMLHRPENGNGRQKVEYFMGIGTSKPRSTIGKLVERSRKAVNAGIAVSFPFHVMRAYKYLVENYTEGDRICLFGFSRGAYVARALAGMIAKVGLLHVADLPNDRQLKAYQERRDELNGKIAQLYSLFERRDDQGWKDSENELRENVQARHGHKVKIEFLGLWDTVASVGFTTTYHPFVGKNPALKSFRHAVALDERRGRFSPRLYNGESTAGLQRSNMDVIEETWFQKYQKFYAESPSEVHETDYLEVWFSGCHGDVVGRFHLEMDGALPTGKGYPPETRLGVITLFWMIRQCFLASTGILFHQRSLQQYFFPERPDWKLHMGAFLMNFPDFATVDHDAAYALALNDCKPADTTPGQRVSSSSGWFSATKVRFQTLFGGPTGDTLSGMAAALENAAGIDTGPEFSDTLASADSGSSVEKYLASYLLGAEVQHARYGTINDTMAPTKPSWGAAMEARLWRGIDVMPTWVQNHAGTDQHTARWTLGRGRLLSHSERAKVKVHYTVALRTYCFDMQPPYKPKAGVKDLKGGFPRKNIEWMGWQRILTGREIRKVVHSGLADLSPTEP